MRELPRERAKSIYRRKYWDAFKVDQLPESVRFDVFGGGMNSGSEQSAKWLQRAAGAEDDGIVGAGDRRCSTDGGPSARRTLQRPPIALSGRSPGVVELWQRLGSAHCIQLAGVCMTPTQIIFAVLAAGNALLGWAWLPARDEVVQARTELSATTQQRNGALQAAQACSDATDGLGKLASQRDKDVGPARAKELNARADYALSTAPMGDTCASLDALGTQ